MKVEDLIPCVSVIKQKVPNKNKRIMEGEYLYLGTAKAKVPIENSEVELATIMHIIQKYNKDSSSKLEGPISGMTQGELEALYEEIYRVDIN